MLDKEKLWIVVYFDIRGLDNSYANHVLCEMRNMLKYDESVNTIIIPSRSETKVNFYNMGDIEPLRLEEFKELVEKIENNKI